MPGAPSASGIPTVVIPMPTADLLAALGPEKNNPLFQRLLPDSFFVLAGKPKDFLVSPVGMGNEWLSSLVIERMLQLPLIDPSHIEFVVQSLGFPVYVPVMIPNSEPPQPQIVPIMRRSTALTLDVPVDETVFLTRILGPDGPDPALLKRTAGTAEYYDLTPPNVIVPQRLAFAVLGERTIVFTEGTEEDITAVFSGTAPRSGVLERLKHTPIDGNELTLLASLEGLTVHPEAWANIVEQIGLMGGIPPHVISMFKQHLHAVTLSLRLSASEGQPVVSIHAESRDDSGAAAIMEAIQGLIINAQTTMATMNEEIKEMLPIPADFAISALNALSVDIQGSRVTAALNNFESLLPAIAEGIHYRQSVEQYAELQERQYEKLELLSRLFMVYNERNGHFPSDIVDAEGKPLLSWRVAVLPLLGLEELYRQFNLDESWESEHNRELLDSMPTLFHPLTDEVALSQTVFRFFDSEGTPFSNRNLKAEDVVNPRGTLMFVKVLPGRAVEWTKPEPLEFHIDTLSDIVGNVLLGVTFLGVPFEADVLSPSDPQYENWKRDIEMLIKGTR